ncbi:MAG TPA: hypothetical protein VG028_22175 [Terriglobia bacterium]|nr:hypothetical protein [Terriglobia bacterium]
MKRSLIKMSLVFAAFCLGASLVALGKGKHGPVSGTWACVAHGTDQGDINYTYQLVQDGEKVTGSFSENSDSGQNADIKDGSFKAKKLNMSFEAYNSTVTITGTMPKKGALGGNWTHSGGAEGTWECTKSAPKAAAQ